MKKHILLLILLIFSAKIHGEEITFTIRNKAKIDKKDLKSNIKFNEDITFNLEWHHNTTHPGYDSPYQIARMIQQYSYLTMKYNSRTKKEFDVREFENERRPLSVLSDKKEYYQ